MIRAILILAALVPSPLWAGHENPEFLTVDVSKLPPGLAKKIRAAAVDSNLPPGLLKKPPTHPGRIAHLKKMAEQK